MKPATTIIRQLGGRRAVSDLTGVTVNAIRQWPRIGIPYRLWKMLQDETTNGGVSGVTVEALMATKPAHSSKDEA